MKISDIKTNEKIFLDSNIFIYHFLGISNNCKNVIQRCSNKELAGISSSIVIKEILHRLMIAEAIQKGLINNKNPVKKLKESPEIVKNLSQYYKNTSSILDMNIEIIFIDQNILELSQDIRQKYGLLTNDSVNIAIMEKYGIKSIVTNDGDFSKIPWLNIYKPSDV